ncbi:MAG: hypothetical protein K0S97_2420 [Chloroflexota bacterium]|jgi:hypothetical protein|nr:hypothetical protein [Chloroflexota bacterium]
MTTIVLRNEHETGIDLAADRLAYLVISYGLLLIVAYRSFVNGESAWDLIGLVILGGVVGLVYRMRQGVVSGRWTLLLVATMGLAILVAGVVAIAMR